MNKTATVIQVANRKGGVAKTTTVASLSGIAASDGFKVLMIDLDTQGNLSEQFLGEDIPEDTIVQAFYKNKLPIVHIRKNLDIIPVDSDLAQVEADLGDDEADQFILRKALKPALAEYDFIFLDCAPAEGWVLRNALNVCDFLLVPMMMDSKSLKGVDILAKTCYQVKSKVRIGGIVFTNYDPRRKITRRIEPRIRASYGEVVMDTTIRPCSQLSNGADEHKDIIAYDPKCNAAVDYTALFHEILKKCGIEVKQ